MNVNSFLIREIDEAGFQAEVLGVPGPVLVAFQASWSRPCRAMTSMLEQMVKSSRQFAKVLKVDVDDQVDLGIRFGIQSIPTVLGFVNGRECARILGAMTVEAFLAQLEPLLRQAPPNLS